MQHFVGAFRDQGEAASVGDLDDEDAGADPLRRRAPERQFAEIDDRQGDAVIVEHPGDARRRLRQTLDLHQREDFHEFARIERVTVLAELEDDEEHRIRRSGV